MGVLNVTFDDNGEVQSWSGNPVLLDSKIQQGRIRNVFHVLFSMLRRNNGGLCSDNYCFHNGSATRPNIIWHQLMK